MYLQSLQVASFRNLAPQQIQFSEGINLIIGKNGQGKTNILEAIHVLATCKSFRSSSLREIIQYDHSEADIKGLVIRQGISENLRLHFDSQGRRAWIGNKVAYPIQDYLRFLKVVAFTPDDLSMIKGGPAVRRRFMDRSVFLLQPDHWRKMREFNISLKSRNLLLKNNNKKDLDQIESFTLKMAQVGAGLSLSRKKWIQRMEKITNPVFEEIIGGKHQLNLIFSSGWNIDSGMDPSNLFDQWRETLPVDIKRKHTTIGPQQDDFEIRIDNKAARKYSSQGQQRLATLAILLATVVELISKENEKPVILLDDVSSELDKGKRDLLFEKIQKIGGQVIVTTTDEKLVGDLVKQSHRRLRVEAGKACEEN